LILDDEESNRKLFRAVVERLGGISVLEADSCAAAVQHCTRRVGVHLLIADLTLPDGFGTSAAIQLLNGNSSLRTIFVSGTPLLFWPDQPQRDIESLPSGSWEFLSKPFLPHTLLSAARRILIENQPTILFAEDSEALRYAVGRSLEVHGFRVLAAANGAEALRRSREHAGRIDLLLTDYRMPQLDGTELADVLIKERPGVPVLFVSATDTDEFLKTHPGVILMRKPFELEALVCRINELLDDRPKAAAAQA
jgi:CheY-like chemotaxis protein